MAVDFREKRKKQQYLVLVVLGVLIVSGAVLYFGYFRSPKEAVVSGPAFVPRKDIKINYEILESPILNLLDNFPETPEFEGELGKDNPFLP